MSSRELPAFIEGFAPVRPFQGLAQAPAAARVWPAVAGRNKLLRNIKAAFDGCNISDGAILSFHRHLRNGDQVLNQVLAAKSAFVRLSAISNWADGMRLPGGSEKVRSWVHPP